MSTKEAINFGLRKFSFNGIRDNQRKLVEACLSDRDVWMITPTSWEKVSFFDHLNICLAFLLPTPRCHGLPLFARKAAS